VKTIMFSFMKNHQGSVIPSTRIARFIEQRLKCPVYWMNPDIKDQKVDNLIIINGAYAFCKVLDELSHAIINAKRVIWVQNDYTIIPPKAETEATSAFRKAFNQRRLDGKPHITFWTTCENNSRVPGSSYVNWNALTWEPLDEKEAKKRRAKASNDLLYYGSYRHVPKSASMTREKYFDRYLAVKDIPITISSPGRNELPNEQFEKRFPNAKHVGKFQTGLVDELSRHGAGLYIEDVKSHVEFHSPANRFYEMASAGLPIIFQIESVRMLEKAGINVAPWAALTTDKLRSLFEDREKIAKEQLAEFRRVDHRGLLDKQFRAALKKLEA
jgi:hypothetical protein